MKNSIMFALAIAFIFTAWAVEAKRETAPEIRLVTAFDFSRYPACQSPHSRNCILAIRFYDADSNRQLAEVAATAGVSGWQRISGKAKAGALPQRAYAVTLYLDSAGLRKEGPRGATTELRQANE